MTSRGDRGGAPAAMRPETSGAPEANGHGEVGSRGVLTVSIDLELAWGSCDRPLGARAGAALRRERDIVARLLAAFATHDVRATWAIVGHLLLPACSDRRHPEYPRPVVRGAARDWFDQHPTTSEDPLWYGRDLVEMIRDAHPHQEIGSHSHCHVPYDEVSANPAAIRTDVAAARDLHRAFNLPFETFVFPRNMVGHRDLLAAAGIRVYRGRTPLWVDRVPRGAVRTVLQLMWWLAVPPGTVTARLDASGMVDVPGSMLLYSRTGLRRLVSPRRVAARAIGALDRAARTGEIFHLWFHPANFAHRDQEQFEILDRILRHAAALRDRGQLEILPMGAFGVDARRMATAGGGRGGAEVLASPAPDPVRVAPNVRT